MERVGCAAEVQSLGDGEEVAKLAQIQIEPDGSGPIWLFCSVYARTVSLATKSALDVHAWRAQTP